MKIEHFALNVPDPEAMAEWYGEHLGTRVQRKVGDEARTHFLVDSQGSVMLEFYNNPEVESLEFPRLDPLHLHLAFVSADPEADASRLTHAGATLEERKAPADGSLLIMMRDPWGVPIQLCRRGRRAAGDPR